MIAVCRYSRFENNREMSTRGRDSLGAAVGGAAAAASLIDLNDTDQATPPSSQLAGLSEYTQHVCRAQFVFKSFGISVTTLSKIGVF